MPREKVIDYYFAPMSGYAYLGHNHLLEIAATAGACVRYHSLDMAQVFTAARSFPPTKYPDIRQHHRKADMVRWAKKRGLKINATPAFWPVPMALACATIMAAGHVGADQGAVSEAVLSAVWVHELDISVPEDIAKALERKELDADSILQAATDPTVIAQAEAETQGAIARGIFGSPTYVFKDDWFFGQDRLAFLAERLS